ncbi:PREDICTED: 30S ribosomal protein S31, mitochondrial [Tarenaya hassleriana]|uniref:30S ribosomal protein S31, mitochondrial n=1 Tax=Tarenaya hassleriana TaxID=28532 RepID=UPI00053C8653|nr:PREDICTED: 30S ribosomal protein S31, mitochondrial [Tarenaya hassleriana]
MAMTQWCGAMARRMMLIQRLPASLSCSVRFSSISPASASEMEVCGRGDKKTKKGKRFKGSYGNARVKKKKMIERIKDKVEVPRILSLGLKAYELWPSSILFG